MAEDLQIPITSGRDDEGESSAVQPVSDRRSVVGASLAGGVIGGSLLGMMGFSLLASSGLLVVSLPLFLVFSPILLIAGVVLVATVASFSLAMVMGVAGTAIFWWLFKEFMNERRRLRHGQN